jgi:5-methylcytosine-specific restriction endonuclease McrA
LAVFVLDKRNKPLMLCCERARLLLTRGRAVVVRRYPFTIRLKDRVGGEVQPVRLELDPGSKTTGIAVVTKEDGNKPAEVLCLIELCHRGRQISEALTVMVFRRCRRGANLGYPARRFDNRTRPGDWLAPSLQHRGGTCMSRIDRLRRWAGISAISTQLRRFDTQPLENPQILGYQQARLAGYQVREYVFEKFGRHCVYCGALDVPLNRDHVVVRSRGGSYQVTNLVPSCIPCNWDRRQALSIEEFLDPKRLAAVKPRLKAPHRADGYGCQRLLPSPEGRSFRRGGF